MATRKADATWRGSLTEGDGTLHLPTGNYEGPYSFKSRFEEGNGTNPEELIAAAHAGCFSMAFSGALGRAGYAPQEIRTEASVHLRKGEGGFEIHRIDLVTDVKIENIEDDEFKRIAEEAKQNCPVSKVLRAAEITLEARRA